MHKKLRVLLSACEQKHKRELCVMDFIRNSELNIVYVCLCRGLGTKEAAKT